MASRLPVVAAIPNFNMAENLRILLPQALGQGYDGVFVLDDASTDHSVDVVSGFGSEVTLLRSNENRGAGANRNQIIEHVEDGTLIHFLDADMELKTSQTAAIAREVVARYADRNVGLIGGLVTRADGSQEPDNYGAVCSLWGNLTSNVPVILDHLRGNPRLAAAIARLTAPIARDWPNVLEPPAATATYWIHEGNMLVNSTLFRSIGGYDPVMRCHEIQDLVIRLEKMSLKRQFDPSIETVHHHIDVRGKNRRRWANTAMWYLIRKHGLYRWLTDR